MTDFLDSNVQRNISLQGLNSWHIGGECEYFCQPKDIEQLQKILLQVPVDMPITWLGLGSNVLIRKIVPGLVIHTKYLNDLLLKDDLVYAQSGVTCAKLAKFCSQHDLLGGEFFAGIPGTVGGALSMNAGAWGGQTWEVVDSVYTINRQADIFVRTPQDFKIGYRTAMNNISSDEAYLGAKLKLIHKPGAGDEATKKIKVLLKKRSQSQPIGTFNCGSVFTNPPNDHAARLIEASGLKGHQIGGAIISEKHANFIINSDHASSDDVEALIALIQQTVVDRFGVKLEPEVRIIGATRSVNRCHQK